ncbi:hypothetical protein O8H94_001144 [Escherichia coli O157]|nr:hypothetical protein [Escherichia coli O157]EKH6014582.1 hypothetical protein [Escherichia coli O157]EKH6024612.1 hypothetical protein [Escherichia coli O157]EKH6094048.1 hypothetical protein [Escherichia coli O157]
MNRRDLENHPLLVGVVNNWHRTLVSALVGQFKIKADVVEQLNEVDVYRCSVIIEGKSQIQELVTEICTALNAAKPLPVIAQRTSNKAYDIGGVSHPVEVREYFTFSDANEQLVRKAQFVMANVIKDHYDKLVAELKRDIGAETDA